MGSKDGQTTPATTSTTPNTPTTGRHCRANGTSRHIPPQPRYTDHWAPRTRKRHRQEHRPQRPTERSDPTQHAKGRTSDCPGPRKGAATRRNVTPGGCRARAVCGTPKGVLPVPQPMERQCHVPPGPRKSPGSVTDALCHGAAHGPGPDACAAGVRQAAREQAWPAKGSAACSASAMVTLIDWTLCVGGQHGGGSSPSSPWATLQSTVPFLPLPLQYGRLGCMTTPSRCSRGAAEGHTRVPGGPWLNGGCRRSHALCDADRDCAGRLTGEEAERQRQGGACPTERLRNGRSSE